jgi:3-hydroxyacyl-[acyl-carrier-protein] dehydratase
MDIQQIMEILPHRFPFLLVDRILELETGKRVVGLKNVTVNEPFFTGHYPSRPIMPGVLILEAMAQIGGFLMLEDERFRGKLPLLAGVDAARFRKPVVPGDQLRMEVEFIRERAGIAKVSGKAFVDGKVVAEAELLFAVV